MSRAEVWKGITPAKHLLLIDDALDRNDARIEQLRRSISADLTKVRADMVAGFDKCEQRDNTMRTLLISLLVSIVLASIGIVATVLVAGAG